MPFAWVSPRGLPRCGLTRHNPAANGIWAIGSPRSRAPFARRSHLGPSRVTPAPSGRNNTGKVPLPLSFFLFNLAQALENSKIFFFAIQVPGDLQNTVVPTRRNPQKDLKRKSGSKVKKEEIVTEKIRKKTRSLFFFFLLSLLSTSFFRSIYWFQQKWTIGDLYDELVEEAVGDLI